jgi:hypothetical protein
MRWGLPGAGRATELGGASYSPDPRLPPGLGGTDPPPEPPPPPPLTTALSSAADMPWLEVGLSALGVKGVPLAEPFFLSATKEPLVASARPAHHRVCECEEGCQEERERE